MDIGRKPWRIVVRLGDPGVPFIKVVKQFGILWSHIAGPDHFRAIDVRAVIDPFVKNEIMVRFVANKDQMVPGGLFELLHNVRPIEILLVLGAPRANPTRPWSGMK